ncbi:hypothetical protein ASD67_02225 [Sphingopyxis sp. Root1497]|uniref:putative signal transducing protein n=1 Tax=Sphingopyxis sp. Root1497 TaxID=1736474 RepID=UPI00070147A3|nr:DUF2007 domain-containing protein [Sphingopyxis sp. Root1497]KQZ65925.1 hypothetical protein ASD67_02225 [Sphingopyxis sp. Root1497]
MALVELVRLPNGVEAELLRGRLESAGVHAVCFDAGMNIAESVGLLIPVRVMVLDDDLADAQALMAEFGAG